MASCQGFSYRSEPTSRVCYLLELMKPVYPRRSVRPHALSPIRLSTAGDLAAIHTWLVDEHAKHIEGNFLCNWKLTARAHRDRRLLVYVDPPSGLAAGYQWGGLTEPGILQVKSDMRGRGIGRALVQYRIHQALRKDDGLLFIECTPSSSVPFWQKMGFTLHEVDGKTYGYRVLGKALALLPGGVPLVVEIRFYAEEAKWNPVAAPLQVFTPQAFVYSDGLIRLSERVHFFERLYPDIGDAVVEVLVNGKSIYRDKAKYDAASRLGLRCCRSANGYFLDRLAPTP